MICLLYLRWLCCASLVFTMIMTLGLSLGLSRSLSGSKPAFTKASSAKP